MQGQIISRTRNLGKSAERPIADLHTADETGNSGSFAALHRSHIHPSSLTVSSRPGADIADVAPGGVVV